MESDSQCRNNNNNNNEEAREGKIFQYKPVSILWQTSGFIQSKIIIG